MRALVAGAGVMGSLHIRALLNRPDISTVTVVEPVRRESGPCWRRAYTHFDDALVHPVDFAIVAVPTNVAADVTGKLIEYRIPVLAEKPLAATVDEAHQLAEIAERANVLLSVGYIERFNPAVRRLRAELVCSGVRHAHAQRLSPIPGRNGAHIALDVATHDIDTITYLTGQRPVAAAVGNGAGGNTLVARLRYDDDLTARVDASWIHPEKIRTLTVTTDRGFYALDYLTQDLRFNGRPIPVERREPLVAEHDAFINAVRNDGPAPVSAHDAIQTLAVAQAMIEEVQCVS